MSPTDRQERIPWWRQDLLRQARFAVMGAGALGNEVVKNLALLGVGEIHIFDFDQIETSNLSRAPLFHASDAEAHRPKAEVLAARAREIHVHPQARVVAHHLDIVWDLGGGFLREMDCVLGCVDNLEARLAVARQCYQFSRPLIDGGIQAMDGRVQLHLTGQGACFDCTIADGERRQLEARYSCEKVMRAYQASGRIPAVQVTSALISAIMCQEAVRWLHGKAVPFGSALTWLGDVLEFDRLAMIRRPDCLTCSAPPAAPARELPLGADGRASDLVAALPPGWAALLPSPFLLGFECGRGHTRLLGKPSHRCLDSELVCALHDDAAVTLRRLDRLDDAMPPEVAHRRLRELGFPPQAAFFGVGGDQSALFLLRAEDPIIS